jgi:hypothetical protein
LPDEQKNVIESWVTDMNTNMLGLQRRVGNISSRLDERQDVSKNSGVQESPEETPLPMQPTLHTTPSFRETLVPVSSSRRQEVPQNTFIEVVHEESDVWGGAEAKP